MIIQIVLVPALVLAVVLSLRSRASLRGQARRKIFAAVTVVAGALAVLFREPCRRWPMSPVSPAAPTCCSTRWPW